MLCYATYKLLKMFLIAFKILELAFKKAILIFVALCFVFALRSGSKSGFVNHFANLFAVFRASLVMMVDLALPVWL